MRELLNDTAMRFVEASQVLRLYAPGPLTEATILWWGWQFETWATMASFGLPQPSYGLNRYPTACG
jgi:hypothetical protein